MLLAVSAFSVQEYPQEWLTRKVIPYGRSPSPQLNLRHVRCQERGRLEVQWAETTISSCHMLP